MTVNDLYQKLLGIVGVWYVEGVELDEKNKQVTVRLSHFEGARFRCPHCQGECGIYDHTPPQTWEHLKSCSCRTFLVIRMPRVRCKVHGVVTVHASWGSDIARVTKEMECHAIDVLKECDTAGATRLIGLDWHTLWTLAEKAVERGLKVKPKRVPAWIGIDEKSFGSGHDYQTLVFDIEYRTVEYVGEGRTKESLKPYFTKFDKEELEKIEVIAVDLCKPYVKAIKEHVPGAAKKIVYDRFHVMKMMNKAVDTVRKEENSILLEDGDETLKKTKYLWLWNHENIPEARLAKFNELRTRVLKVARAWAIKESLRDLWTYRSLGWAQRFFKHWFFWATHSRLKPIIKVGESLTTPGQHPYLSQAWNYQCRGRRIQ